MNHPSPILDVRNLSVRFSIGRGKLFARQRYLHAVRDVSFSVHRGRTLGVVGESGSGKTTAAMAAIGLTPAYAGHVEFAGRNLLALSPDDMCETRRKLQVVFQDPYSSLNPRVRVGAAVREPMDLMGIGTPAERETHISELFELVGLHPDQMVLFPHQFSGGQRQRISIARALAPSPDVIVCDEPVSALDVAIQAQILNLLRKLQVEFGVAYLFISHDLGVVRFMCDDVVVMYLGEVVETATREDLFEHPRHPYTRALLDSAPSVQRRKSRGYTRVTAISGDPPSPVNLPKGCAFAARCPCARPNCREDAPKLKTEGARSVACHFPL